MKKLLAFLFIGFFVMQLIVVPGVHAANMPFTAMGQVLDRLGHPVHGANVTLYDGTYTVISTTTTDANGHFNFTDVIANSPGCKATVTFNDSSKTNPDHNYEISLSETIWYPTDSGTITFDTMYTTLRDYPAPEYGYIWGIMQQDGSNQKALGNGVVYVSASGDPKYYTFTDADKGTFIMRLPVGHYRVWGQYMQNGKTFQSVVKEVDVVGATNYLDVNNIVVSVPLSLATQNPNPSNMPTNSQVNVVSGFVTYKDGRPVVGQAVLLYQATDNGSGYLKTDETETDRSGFYQFRGVDVTADAPDNGVVYSSKSFNITTVYSDLSDQTYSDSRTVLLHNPDFLTQNASEDQTTRNPVVNLTILANPPTEDIPVPTGEQPVHPWTSLAEIIPVVAAIAVGAVLLIILAALLFTRR